MKKILSIVIACAMLIGCVAMLASCGSSSDDFKIGFICLHDDKSTYDLNFINAAKATQKALGLSDDQVLIKVNVPEGQECLEAARDLVDNGCKIVFADSFGHEEFLIAAAKEFPEVQFCHATGTMAHTEGLDNYHNAFASIYEGRYLAGVAAGLKINEMISSGKITAEQAVMGYVGAFTYAEVISGYTSFYLGAKSVCDSVTMKVQFTGSWYDAPEERNAALKLMEEGCVLISQHADSMGAPSACEERGVPDISYNGSTVETCPNTFIVSSAINWQPYFEYIIKTVKDGENGGKIATDWTGTIETGSVVLSEVNTKAAAANTAETLEQVKAKIVSGEVKIFDINTFTVGGAKVTTYLADIDTDAAYTGDTEVIINGYFNESVKRSAPAFDLRIDGITLLNEKY